ncbi:hypothetical protein [Calidithermus chliarophilus]|uniref:hypothetical protein n=1 Tax=Calidithermus chliarophilus TaxID=52023 RepID=UPI00040544F0|nr:hypothetical protein [Calidithermus chliarophilus]
MRAYKAFMALLSALLWGMFVGALQSTLEIRGFVSLPVSLWPFVTAGVLLFGLARAFKD